MCLVNTKSWFVSFAIVFRDDMLIVAGFRTSIS